MRKKWKIRLLLVGICLICLPYALGGCSAEEEWIYFSDVDVTTVSGEVSTEESLADASDETGAEEEIVVYLCGAVNTAGIVVLPEGSRINEAIQAAGGFTENAAVTAINLAEKLEDEQMVYVPTLEEVEEGRMAVTEWSGLEADKGLININTADIYTLCSLPGIGESRAKGIVAYREKNGAFQKKEDIMQVDGIKENLYREIEDLISVK